MIVKVVEFQGDFGGGGGGRGGSSVWLEFRVFLDLGLDYESMSVVDLGFFGLVGVGLFFLLVQLQLRVLVLELDRELLVLEGEVGQSLVDSGIFLFSFLEVISVWERLLGLDSVVEGQDDEFF